MLFLMGLNIVTESRDNGANYQSDSQKIESWVKKSKVKKEKKMKKKRP